MTLPIAKKGPFPDIPRNPQLVDMATGRITTEWFLYLQQLNLALQTNFKTGGIVIPQLTATEIGNLGNIFPSIGNIVYDQTNKVFKGIVADATLPDTLTKTFVMI